MTQPKIYWWKPTNKSADEAHIGVEFEGKKYAGKIGRQEFSDAEEGNAPIQDPMEFGEMANWTPLDGSEGLKRKRAEFDDFGRPKAKSNYYHLANTMDESQQEDTDALKARASHPMVADFIQNMAEWGFNNQDHSMLWDAMVLVIEADERGEFEEHIEMLELDAEVRIPQPASGTWSPAKGGSATISKTSGIRNIGTISPSATIPVNYPKHLQPDWQDSEPAWVKPVATALGFALGFFGIHEIKKVL